MTKTEQFLISAGLHETCFDFEEQARDFMSEMDAGLANRGGSLLMLPGYLGITPQGLADGDVIAVDAGGTNLRVALVRFSPGDAPVLRAHESFRIPGTDGSIRIETFFERVADHIGDRIEKADRIGFCFSFPCEIGADRDGRIIRFNKELEIEGAEGLRIGVGLNAAFARAGKPAAKVTALNDTSAALIGVTASQGFSDMGGYVCLICGTGFNICYFDARQNMLINTEAGGYAGFRQSLCDVEVDAESDNPGDHRFEKMVSGAYFAKVALAAARLAASGGLVGERTAAAIGALASFDMVQIDRFMRAGGRPDAAPGQCCAASEDATVLYELFDGLYNRSAKLIAIAVTAVMRKGALSGGNPALLVAEGSMFRKGFRMQERFARQMALRPADDQRYELILADDHTLIGAAASVFL